jgi:hypothetical protein
LFVKSFVLDINVAKIAKNELKSINSFMFNWFKSSHFILFFILILGIIVVWTLSGTWERIHEKIDCLICLCQKIYHALKLKYFDWTNFTISQFNFIKEQMELIKLIKLIKLMSWREITTNELFTQKRKINLIFSLFNFESWILKVLLKVIQA